MGRKGGSLSLGWCDEEDYDGRRAVWSLVCLLCNFGRYEMVSVAHGVEVVESGVEKGGDEGGRGLSLRIGK